MTVKLVTVPDVEIVSTGTYPLASGPTTFSAQHLADAVAAFNDPTVTAPRLKIGHTDPRFAQAIASGELDGEPAFGVLANLRLTNNGQTIVGDYTNVPEWLAEALPSSYPGRSIEGGFNYTAASGRKYSLVITACALLGVTWPGVGSLEDLREVLTANGEAINVETDDMIAEPVIARVVRPGEPGPAERLEVLAGMDVGDVRMQFLEDCDAGRVPMVPGAGPMMWWWPRSVRVENDGTLNLIVDDDDGHLIQIPFTVDGQDVSYGDATMVVEQYVPVAAAAGEEQERRVVASFLPARAARPSNPTEVTTMRINGSEVDAAPLRERLGLAADVDESAIYDALGISPEPEAPEPEAPEPEAPEPVAAAAPAVPEGMVLIDEETLAGLQAGVQTANQLAARAAQADRDRIVQQAIEEGRIPVAARARYTERWDRDAEGTRHLLTAAAAEGGLAPGLVPVNRAEIGRNGDGEGDPSQLEAGHDEFMARHFASNYEKLRARRGVRVRQEA